MSHTTDPEFRAEFINSLRELADFLAANPAVPVPMYGTRILLAASSIEDDGQIEVDRFACLLGATITNDIACTGHYEADRDFGPVRYSIAAISDSRMAAFRAESSYWGCVIPDIN